MTLQKHVPRGTYSGGDSMELEKIKQERHRAKYVRNSVEVLP